MSSELSEWLLPADTMPLTLGEAQTRQDEARAQGVRLIWFVGLVSAAGNMVMARAHTLDFRKGMLLPGGLVASTLNELRQMMPLGLTRKDRSAWDPVEIVETWE